MENPENYYNSDFQHGYVIGVENIRKDKDKEEDPYEGYLSSHITYEWLQERIAEKQVEVTKLDAEIAETKEKQKTSFDKLQEHVMGIGTHSRKVGFIQEQINNNSQRLTYLEDKRNRSESPYSLFAGILYFFAGIAFVTGDLIISHEIVAYALNIRDNYEAWAFAIGLAMLSVLLKPAYDRLVEQPYINDYSPQTKRTYAIFQGFLIAFSVATMLILGWFRYEAYKTDKLKESINKQIKSMQLGSQSMDPTATSATDNQAIIQKMDEQLKAYDKLNLDLVNSPWALMSFVLSGVLFAIAGAICLGISFPIMQAYWYRWLQAGPSIQRIKKKNLKLIEELKIAEDELAQQVIQKSILENDLALLPNLNELKAEKREIVAHIEEMLSRSKVADQDRRINTFDDGLEKGKANREEMTEDEYEEFRSTSVRQMRNAQDTKTDSGPKVYRNNGLRPHQALRKVITEQFNQN
ncbi:hypothetical protein EMA8858_02701 [Emticicia aquatica]|uniref:DUF4407 domain-containing protein n=1 Tax=Emticicia aquatica TaxID=1681835 RepID=A0ABN8EU36_9BACT|nr:hypothetical protein [Emticicia aquatica]CAH0996569.1 hypothetical protein EMA8858_02701 [Emticicia aquatica]